MTGLSTQVLELAIQVQQIPAPTFHERLRAEFVRSLFLREGLSDVAADELGNVYARLAGRGRAARPLILSAHLDTVFPEQTGLQIVRELEKISGPGIGDNSLGVAALLGVLAGLRGRHIELEHDLWFVANVGEEGLGDLCGMRKVVERFGADVAGYLVLEGLALGHVYHRAIGVKRYRIQVQTAGGHSWSDYGRPSAVHELAALVTKLTSIHLPREPRTTMNVGTISGGSGINVLASQAVCELDLRSEEPRELERLAHEVEACLAAAEKEEVRVERETIGQRPAGEIPAGHPFVKLAVKCTRDVGLDPILTSGSTDANIPLNLGIPSVVLGITTGGGAHTPREYIHTGPVGKGLECILRFVERVGSVMTSADHE